MSETVDVRIRCKLTGTLEMPRVAGLIEILAKLNPEYARAHPSLIVGHAQLIYGHWLELQYRQDQTSYLPGTRALRVPAKKHGITKELRRLMQLAKGKSETRWRTGWLGVSGLTRSVVMREAGSPTIIERAGQRHFDAAAFYMISESSGSSSVIVPHLADAALVVEAALRKVEAIPAAQRRIRTGGDELTEAFEDAVDVAFREITGKEKWGLKSLIKDIALYLSAPKT